MQTEAEDPEQKRYNKTKQDTVFNFSVISFQENWIVEVPSPCKYPKNMHRARLQ